MGFPSGHSGFCPRMLAPPANTFPRNALFPFQQASIRVLGVAPGKCEQFSSGVPPMGHRPYWPVAAMVLVQVMLYICGGSFGSFCGGPPRIAMSLGSFMEIKVM